MKVLYLVNIPSPYKVDFFNDLSKYCDLTVVFEDRKSGKRDKKWSSDEGIKFKSVFLDGVRIKNKLVYSKQLVEIARQEWDIVVLGVYMIPSAIYLNCYYSRKHKPFFIHADGGFIKKDSWLMDKIKRTLISKASAWITSGPETTDYFEYYGAKKERCFEYPFSSIRNANIVGSLADRKKIMLEARKKLALGDRKIILAVGQFIPIKGFDVLLKAIPKLSCDADVFFVGGIPVDDYKNICAELKLKNVFFEGFKTKNELATYYQAADLFVFPTRGDVWGLVINEAMGYGLPIVTTDKCIAGIELVENGKNGYVVKTGNVDELADGINKILLDDTLSDQMTINNIDRIKGYTIETMALEYKKIFENIMAHCD